jgi:flavorubredoxin
MKSTILYDEGGLQWIAMGRDPQISGEIVDTVQYMVVADGEALLIDPGGIEIFPQVLTEVTGHVDITKIGGLFASHQDPDIASSMSLWSDLSPGLKVFTPKIWVGFLTHLCLGTEIQFEGMPDHGGSVPIGHSRKTLQAIPAHYCHSSGNYSLWDSRSRILFSGDVGAALLPDREGELFVDDFDQHIQYMEGFHKRWMPANAPLRAWVSRVRELKPNMICPQHGSIFRGENVERFLDWLERLDVEALDPSRQAAMA